MMTPKIEKVVVNIGVGESGEQVEKAVKLLEILTGKKPVKTSSVKRIPAWGVRPKQFIGAKVTLRLADAEEFLKRVFVAAGGKLNKKQFDRFGNFSFGLKEYLDIPGVRYDPSIGMFGMDINVSVGRAGYRVKRRRLKRSKLGTQHILTRDESVKFVSQKFGIKVI
ncbi:MAG: 50S ribosomal protein L5 [Candidatus Altiarchaeota archaeon]|nr:50S ribosomal protein L5 [Candidatus Altiarchaeota archaeon]